MRRTYIQVVRQNIILLCAHLIQLPSFFLGVMTVYPRGRGQVQRPSTSGGDGARGFGREEVPDNAHIMEG